MIRQTSLDVFNRIRNEGLLSKRKFEIYQSLFKHGPATANELFKVTRGISSVSQANIQPRLHELVLSGAVREVEVRECQVTKNKVIVYDVTDGLPVKFEKTKKTKCKHCNGHGYITTTQAVFDIN
jgi:DnaJ-class molecular chaperone